MAAINAIAAGNWYADRATVWSSGDVPTAGDEVDLAGYVVAWDTGAGATIPATGSFASLTASGVGQLSINLLTLRFNVTLNSVIITAGTLADGFVKSIGTSTNSLTINATTITGGPGTDNATVTRGGLNNDLVVNATTVQGGAGLRSYGINVGTNPGTYTLNTTNSIGGTGQNSHGIFIYGGTGSVSGTMVGGTTTANTIVSYGLLGYTQVGGLACTFNNVNLVYSASNAPIGGYPPGTWNIGASNYIQFGAQKLTLSSISKLQRNLDIYNWKL